MGQTEVTIGAYERYRKETNAEALPDKDSFGRKLNIAAGDPNQPVVMVTWDEARAYCRWVDLDLPSEAEWEYAARAGTKGSRYAPLDQIAWHGDNSGRRRLNTTQMFASDSRGYAKALFENGNMPRSVASKGKPSMSPWKLYDMLGNVWEWTADWYDEKFYGSGSVVDPLNTKEGKYRVIRGGAWIVSPGIVRVSVRHRYLPSYRINVIGFRCAGEIR